MVTYHNLHGFSQKKDYYLKWIHLLDNSLSVIFVADLSQFADNNGSLLKDIEIFRRLMYYSNGKYDVKMPILVISGIDQFNQYLCDDKNRRQFETEFNQFQFYNDTKNSYYDQALQHIKDQYMLIFENNLPNGAKPTHKLFIRTINNVRSITEVQNVWVKLNKAIIHGNIMHELRNGGIAL